MEPKPLSSSQPPDYPTRRDVLAGAASLALVGLTRCDFAFAETDGTEVAVAPIFEHGEGRGATGCVVVAPPAFLSEEEALQIIREELAKHGVQLKAGTTLESVRVPPRREHYEEVDNNGRKELKESVVEDPGGAKPLELDGVDADKHVGVEFISEKDYFDLGGVRSGSTAQGYDFKEVAQHLAKHAKKQGKGPLVLGVFYDPASPISVKDIPRTERETDFGAAWRKARAKSADDSKKLLRQQAQDFVVWLKKRKTIE